MLLVANLPPVLIAALHVAVPVLIHDEFLCIRLLKEAEIVCATIAIATRRYFVDIADSVADRTAGRDAPVAVASTSALPPRARRTISGNAPFGHDDHQSLPSVSYDDI